MNWKTPILIGLSFILLTVNARAQYRSPPKQVDTSRDMYCRRDAAARTGYVTPRDAERDAQARAAIGGLLGGAALGAIFGGRNRGGSAGLGAGAGLIAGLAVGSSNGRAASNDVRRRYSDAYYACMDAGVAPLPGPGYAPPTDAIDGPPPPPPGDAGGPPPTSPSESYRR